VISKYSEFIAAHYYLNSYDSYLTIIAVVFLTTVTTS